MRLRVLPFAILLVTASPAWAMAPQGGTMECDAYLNVYRVNGEIVSTWISYENCIVVGDDLAGGGGGRDGELSAKNFTVEGVTPDTNCFGSACCLCRKGVAQAWKACYSLADKAPTRAGRVLARQECDRKAESGAINCHAPDGGSCA